MVKLPQIFVVDDRLERLQWATEALTELETPTESISPLHVETPTEYIEARERLRTATGRGIVLLDLGFRSPGQGLWPEVADSLKKLSVYTGATFYEPNEQRAEETLSLQTAMGGRTITGSRLDGLSLAEAIITNKRFEACLVIVCSSLGSLGNLPLFLDMLNETAIRVAGGRMIFVRERHGRDFSDSEQARDIVRDLETYWVNHFPEFSPEPRIDSTVREWLGYFRSLGETKKDEFCWHDHIASNVDAYAEALAKGLGYAGHIDSLRSSIGLKAIFMLPRYALSSVEWPSSAFTLIKGSLEGFHNLARPIPQDMLRSMVKADDRFDLVMVDKYVKLPIVPGLPFILSLLGLLGALRKEEMLAASTTIKIVSGESGTTRLTIPLKQEPAMEFGLARTWIRKMEGGAGTLSSGICGCLWNVMRGKVQISARSTADIYERRLLQLFEGQDRPIVGLHFAPHFIHLYWN